MPLIILIAAIASNRVIGCQGKMPWHLPEDLARFRRVTMGHAIAMGRKTFETIGRPLNGRHNIVVSSTLSDFEGVTLCRSIDTMLSAAKNEERLYVIGGETLFRQTLPLADRLDLTLIDGDYPGDVFFPDWDSSQWQKVSDKPSDNISGSSVKFSFVCFTRIED